MGTGASAAGHGPAAGPSLGPVGRGAEIARLHDSFDRVRRGRAARILLTGESGIGTSTLADAFCAQLSGGTAVGPVVVRVAAPEPPTGPGDVAPAYATTERLARALDAVTAPARATAARSALGLHDTLVRTRQGPTGPRPVVVVLHDLHHADPASALVLADLLARLRTGRLLVLATATEPARLPAGTRAWWTWLFAEEDSGAGGPGTEVRTVVVGGLDAAGVAAFVASRRPAAPLPGPRVAQRLVAATGGHPVHLALLVRGLSDDVLAGTAPSPPWRSPAIDVAAAAEPLRPVARAVLDGLAVLGGPAPVALVEQVAGYGAGAVGVTEVEELDRCGLVVVEHDRARTVLSFVHRSVRAAVLDALAPEHAGVLHRGAAVAVGGRAGLAHAVAGAAGRPDPALACALEDSAAAEVSDHDEAATRLLWAAELSTTGAQREARVLAAAVCLVQAGAMTRLHALEPLLRGARPGAERDLAIGVLLAEASDPEAHTWLQAAVDDPDADPRTAALAAVRLGTDHALHGRGARAAQAVARVPELTDDPRRLEQARVISAVGRAQQWGPDAGLETLEDELASAYGPDPAVIAGRLLLAAGRTEEGYARLHEGLDRIRTGAATVTGRLVHLYLAEAAYRTGRFDEAEAEARVGASTTREVGSAWIGPASRAMWASVLAVRGEGAAAEEHLRRADSELRRSPHALGLASVRIAEALVAHVRGDHERAHRRLTALAEGPVPTMLAAPTAPWRVLRAEVALEAGHPAVATEEIDGWPVFGVPLWFALARRRLLGRLAEHAGDPEAAWGAYRAALDLAEADADGARACPAEIAALHACAGVLARARGWGSAAADLATARRCYAALGAQPWVDRLDAEIDSGVPDDAAGPGDVAGVVAVPTPPDTVPLASGSAPATWPVTHAVLTPREREVVRLVAQGLTSREVAAALYVTPKAISYHLGNVFAKLGVTSRRQLWGRRF